MDSQNRQLLSSGLDKLGVSHCDEALDMLERFCELVLAANSRFNLTAIVDEREFVVKHLLDSAAVVPQISSGARLLDIGAGAGFPSVPLAILRRDIQVTSLDSTTKKTAFIAESAEKLGLDNISVVAGRAEEAKDMFGKFDVVVARAVAALPILLELAAPMLEIGGKFVAFKSDDSELSACKNAMRTLNLRHTNTTSLDICSNKRALISFEKFAATPAGYPRRYGAIKKSPL